MEALRFTGGSLLVANVPVPDGRGEALVRVLRSGICSTDIEITRGYAGFEGTLGHEFVGVVEETEERPDLIGKRVVGEINVGCGSCTLCMTGDQRHCPIRTVMGIVGRDGAHAQFLRLPARNLLEVPASVTDQQAVFAEPLAAACGILERVSIEDGERVVIIGDGKLGLLCAMCLARKWPDLVLIGKHASKLAIAERSGVEGILLEDVERSMASTADYVIEASGSESGFALAIDLVRPQGTIVLKSTFHGAPEWQASRVVVDEITILGSRCGRMQPALDILADGIVHVGDLVDEEYRLSDGINAMQRAAGNGVLKILLKPD
jgi:threonine dehydrogenase-like Zn-dependent dehydrogenase